MISWAKRLHGAKHSEPTASLQQPQKHAPKEVQVSPSDIRTLRKKRECEEPNVGGEWSVFKVHGYVQLIEFLCAAW